MANDGTIQTAVYGSDGNLSGYRNNTTGDFSDAKTGAVTPGGSSTPSSAPTTTTPSSSPVTIVTSNQSRSNYANNVNTLNTAIGNTRTVQPGQNASSIAASLGMTPAQFLALNPNFAATGNKGDYQGLSGIIQPGQTYKIGPDGTPQQVDGTTGGGTDTTGGASKNGSAPGGSTGTNTDNSGGVNTGGLDPKLKAQYDEALANLDDNITQAKSTLDQAKATLANDPAAQAAVDAIAAKYDVLITQMKNKNNILLGSYKTNGARSGALQFANDMNSNFMSEEMDHATQRISDLVTQEKTMILKAQQAYKSGDLKAFNDANKAYDDANKGKIDAINKLLTATNNQVKTVQAQQKADQAAKNATITNDIRISTGLASVVAESLSKAGLTDPDQVAQYIQQMSEKAGISNPDILQSAVVKAQQTNAKNDLSEQNTKSIIAKRKSTGTGGSKATGGGKDGAYTYSGDDVSTYTKFLNQGGTGPDGTKYNARGTDAYVDPKAYTAIYNAWSASGGTPAGFLKKFPITNVNPDSRDSLPEGLTAKK